MAFSMIVEMTSLTPRPTLSRPAIDGPRGADEHRDHDDHQHVQRARAGAARRRPTAAANTAIRYWPSTPMLNRFIRKPMATAIADR